MDTDNYRYKQKKLCNGVLYFLFFFLLQVSSIQAQIFNSTPNTVDFEDFIAFVVSFGTQKGDQNYYPIMDLNDDGKINFPDFISFVKSFGGNFSNPKIIVTIESNTSYQLQDNLSQIKCSFSQPIRIVNENGFILLNTQINLETGVIDTIATKPQSINLSSNRKELTLFLAQIVSNSTQLLLEEPQKTITYVANDSIVTYSQGVSYRYTNAIWVYDAYQPLISSVTLSTPFTPAQATLSLRPFAPTNINFFTPGVYTTSNAMVPATGDTLTETTARIALETFLAKRITNTDTLQQTLSTFSDPNLIAKMPSPTLRAGLLSLKGTLAQVAIDAILRGPFGPLTFGTVTSGDYADVKSDRSVIVDQRYQSEAFPLFGPIFTRMALQTDQQTGRNEETTTASFLALVAMQQTLTDSTIAQSASELSRRLNTQMLARLNSGQTNFPNIGIYQTPNGQAFPNGTSFTSYAAVFAPLEDITTPASTLLSTYLKNLSPEGTALPTTTTFSNTVLTFIDQHQNILSPEDLIRIARILKLITQ